MNTGNIRDLLQTDASTTAIKVSCPSMTPGHSVNTLSPTDLLAGSYSSFILPAASTSAGMIPPSKYCFLTFYFKSCPVFSSFNICA